MAFDVYAGSLTRYYTDRWENVVQKRAREQGYSNQKIGPDGPRTPPSPEEVQSAIADWRQAVAQALGEKLSEPLQWEESVSTPYFTDRPGWEGYSALLLWAAYASAPEAPPERIPETGWADDPVFQRAIERDSGTRYRQILQPELWLPADYDFCFNYPSVVQQPTWIGSTGGLRRDLDELNERTFRASEAELARCLTGEFDAATELEHDALFTLALFVSLAREADHHRLPMILSY
jgi:hypothetical protein